MTAVEPMGFTDPFSGSKGWVARYGTQEISQFRGAEMIAKKWGTTRRGMEEFGYTSHDLTPRARIHHMSVRGSDPIMMLNGPITATAWALDKPGMSIDEIDLFECNEAFACVPLVWMSELHVPHAPSTRGVVAAPGRPHYTPMIRGFIGDNPEIEKLIARSNIGGRLITPEEIVATVSLWWSTAVGSLAERDLDVWLDPVSQPTEDHGSVRDLRVRPIVPIGEPCLMPTPCPQPRPATSWPRAMNSTGPSR